MEPDTTPELEPAPFKVLGDNIIVELVEREEQTDSGLVIVKERQEIPPDVVVVGIGKAAATYFEQVEEIIIGFGSRLMTRRSERVRVELPDDGRELYTLKPNAVIGVFE